MSKSGEESAVLENVFIFSEHQYVWKLFVTRSAIKAKRWVYKGIFGSEGAEIRLTS